MDTPSGGAAGAGRGLSLEEEKAFKDAFPAVMVDTALGFNIFGRRFLFYCYLRFVSVSVSVSCAFLSGVSRHGRRRPGFQRYRYECT